MISEELISLNLYNSPAKVETIIVDTDNAMQCIVVVVKQDEVFWASTVWLSETAKRLLRDCWETDEDWAKNSPLSQTDTQADRRKKWLPELLVGVKNLKRGKNWQHYKKKNLEDFCSFWCTDNLYSLHVYV